MGMVTPVGYGWRENWSNVVNGVCGVERVDPNSFGTDWNLDWDFNTWPVQIAARIKGFKRAKYFRDSAKDLGRGRPFAAQLSIETGGMALEDADLITTATVEANLQGEKSLFKQVTGLRNLRPEGLYVALGSTLGCAMEIPRYTHALDQLDWTKSRGLGGFAAVDMIPDTAASAVSMTYSARGGYGLFATACSSGAKAIEEAILFLEHEKIDPEGARVAIAMGLECIITPVGLAAFISNTALTRDFNANPKAASRPFDRNRSGFVLSEGCSALIIESLQHARERRNRGANFQIYGIIRGFAETADAAQLTKPEGDQNKRCMEKALRVSQLQGPDINYVNAHATSTPDGDVKEVLAIHAAFNPNVMISSTKGQTGHMAGAGGNFEAAMAILATKEGHSAPPGINLDDPEIPANYVTKYDPSIPVELAASNSFAFGGHNLTVIAERYEEGNLTEV